uniref:SFRICE_033125 n=1 Tax=Spodoptera frugiperda TaxID=7108 RepID=A0A2H1VZQ0_SPOFR
MSCNYLANIIVTSPIFLAESTGGLENGGKSSNDFSRLGRGGRECDSYWLKITPSLLLLFSCSHRKPAR